MDQWHGGGKLYTGLIAFEGVIYIPRKYEDCLQTIIKSFGHLCARLSESTLHLWKMWCRRRPYNHEWSFGTVGENKVVSCNRVVSIHNRMRYCRVVGVNWAMYNVLIINYRAHMKRVFWQISEVRRGFAYICSGVRAATGQPLYGESSIRCSFKNQSIIILIVELWIASVTTYQIFISLGLFFYFCDVFFSELPDFWNILYIYKFVLVSKLSYE